ncbi:extracellular solute-binding protein [Spongorhabdus nitratireducens]
MRALLLLLGCIGGLWNTASIAGEQTGVVVSHGIARFDDLKYPAEFSHFDYVNPDAPKGGTARFYARGTFDSMNPYATGGELPFRHAIFAAESLGFTGFNEPLMVGYGSYDPSGDEFHSAYGLIAGSVEYPIDNSWIIFNLRPESRFHDGHPVTAEDVVFSFRVLKEKGHPSYKLQLEPIKSVTAEGSHRVRFDFQKAGTRTQLFWAGNLPVLPAHYWKGRNLEKTTLEPPLGSGPYRVSKVDPGVSVTLSRVKDYWGQNLAVNRGKYNFDAVELQFYRDFDIAFESFKAGKYDVYVDMFAKNWTQGYDFKAMKTGEVKRRAFENHMPYGCTCLFFNVRKPLFKDIRVRKALALLFDFETTNERIFYGLYTRLKTYYPGESLESPADGLGATDLPDPEEQKYLQPWRSVLPAEMFTRTFELPVFDGNSSFRQQQRRAFELLRQAGWIYKDGKLIDSKSGKPFEFDFIHYTKGAMAYVLAYAKNLESVGIKLNYRLVDQSQYQLRMRQHDFDMVHRILPQSYSPDLEQQNYFHSSGVDDPSSLNLAGVNHPAVDFLTEQIPLAKSRQELETLVNALDRVLLWNYYSIPLWRAYTTRVAYRDVFGWPEHLPRYASSFRTWWYRGTPSESQP